MRYMYMANMHELKYYVDEIMKIQIHETYALICYAWNICINNICMKYMHQYVMHMICMIYIHQYVMHEIYVMHMICMKYMHQYVIKEIYASMCYAYDMHEIIICINMLCLICMKYMHRFDMLCMKIYAWLIITNLFHKITFMWHVSDFPRTSVFPCISCFHVHLMLIFEHVIRWKNCSDVK